jgi:hypothetical protein
VPITEQELVMATVDEAQGQRLSGPIVDQAALHGLLVRVRGLSLELIEISYDPGRDSPD